MIVITTDTVDNDTHFSKLTLDLIRGEWTTVFDARS